VGGAAVTYSVDGGDLLDCNEAGEGSWVCGWEAAGEIEVFASAELHEPASAVVTVEADECHVIPEGLQLVLQELECLPPTASAFVMVSAYGLPDGEIPDGTSVFAVPDADEPVAIACTESGAQETGVLFTCGDGITGPMTIYASAEGYLTDSAPIVVEEDACGPIPEDVELFLDLECNQDNVAEPSVFALVSAEGLVDGALPEDTEVWLSSLDSDAGPVQCSTQSQDLTGVLFYCGQEMAGLFQVTATAWEGQSVASAEVNVLSDECGDVIPGNVELMLPAVD